MSRTVPAAAFRSAPERPAAAPCAVAHIGLLGDRPGGMAQLVDGYLRWTGPGGAPVGICSTRRRHDPLQLPLTLRAIAGVLRFARRRGPSVAVVHLSEGGSFVREGGLLLLAAALGVRTVAQVHGADFDDFAARRPGLVRAVLGRADAVAVLTDRSAAVVRHLLPSARVRIVPNVVADPGRPAGARHQVLFGGELGPRKGVDVLLAAWPGVRRAHPEWRLLLAGPDAPGWSLPQLPAGVQHVGAMSHEALLDLLAESSVAVLPSRREALPVFLIEALASRCAVVGTEVGQVPELLGEGAGVVVPPGDADALAAALGDLVADPGLRDRLAAEGRARYEQRCSDAAARPSMEAFWRQVAGA